MPGEARRKLRARPWAFGLGYAKEREWLIRSTGSFPEHDKEYSAAKSHPFRLRQNEMRMALRVVFLGE